MLKLFCLVLKHKSMAVKYMHASTFWVFVQVRDVFPLLRAHCFGADAVTDSFLLKVELAESAVQISLPVDFITVDLMSKHQ